MSDQEPRRGGGNGSGEPKGGDEIEASFEEPWAEEGHEHSALELKWPDLSEEYAFSTSSIIEGQEPILRVDRTEDGVWLLTCHASDLTTLDPCRVCLACLVEKDPSLQSLRGLQKLEKAFRTETRNEWTRTPSEYVDFYSAASDPGGVTFSVEKMHKNYPASDPGWLGRLFFRGNLTKRNEELSEHLMLGDSRAAVVLSLKPLVVAAYTDEFDCVVLLRHPRSLVKQYALSVGSRLLTVNTYHIHETRGLMEDIVPGPRNLNNYDNFAPIIADFVSPDKEHIEKRKREIAEAEWARCQSMGEEAFARAQHKTRKRRYRDGTPIWSSCLPGHGGG